ncbi:MAG: hypothetical protein ACLFM5_11100 [Spirochaetaceae bacterium]
MLLDAALVVFALSLLAAVVLVLAAGVTRGTARLEERAVVEARRWDTAVQEEMRYLRGTSAER